MARQLKRWESPRREGRNDKGKGGSARQRQLRKKFQVLRQKLKDQPNEPNTDRNPNKPQDKPDHQKQRGGSAKASPFLMANFAEVQALIDLAA
jgi:hypothetical protein